MRPRRFARVEIFLNAREVAARFISVGMRF
jgi:hypothetical protein